MDRDFFAHTETVTSVDLYMCRKVEESIEKHFRDDFRRLLTDYGAELEVFDDGQHGVHCIALVCIPSRYDEHGDLIQEYCEFRL